MTVDEIGDCLCMEPRLKSDRDEMVDAAENAGRAPAAIGDHRRTVEGAAPELDPNDLVGQQVLKDSDRSAVEPARSHPVGFPAVQPGGGRSTMNLVGTYNGKMCIAQPYAIDVNEAEKSELSGE